MEPRRLVSALMVAMFVTGATPALSAQQTGWVPSAGPGYHEFDGHRTVGLSLGLAAPLARRLELDLRLHGFAEPGGGATFGGVAADLGIGLFLPPRGLDLVLAAGPTAILVGDSDSGGGGLGGYLSLTARTWPLGRVGFYGDVTGRVYSVGTATYGLGAGVALRLGGGR